MIMICFLYKHRKERRIFSLLYFRGKESPEPPKMLCQLPKTSNISWKLPNIKDFVEHRTIVSVLVESSVSLGLLP